MQHEIELPLQMRVHRVKILCLKKRGLIVSKNENFELFFSKIKKGFKNWILNICHLPPKRIFKKSHFYNPNQAFFLGHPLLVLETPNSVHTLGGFIQAFWKKKLGLT